ncbi:MAG: hypothetical protein COB49_02015 [Alphaproteobacteria bacterium]|nr:MAG: hypothetical protein COB49_02015 [Alphaproteobacteria bacterium]
MIFVILQVLSGAISLYWIVQIKQQYYARAGLGWRFCGALLAVLVFASILAPFGHEPIMAHPEAAGLHVMLAGFLYWFVNHHPKVKS